MTMTDTGWPESIRAFLDNGGHLTDLEEGETTFIPWLGEFVVQDRRRDGFASLAPSRKTTGMEKAARAKFIASAEAVGHGDDARRLFQREDVFNRWARELAADESLCERVEAALPPTMVEEMLEDLEADAKPFRLVVEHRDSYVCATTGDERTGRAILVQGRGWIARGWNAPMSGLPELIFSPEAIATVLSQSHLHAVDKGQG